MTDLAITPASVQGFGQDTETLLAGGTITQGMAVYKSNNTLLAALSDSAAHAAVAGLALCGASAGQPCTIQKSGAINPGGTLSLGKTYVLSTANGAIKPVDDIAGTEYITVIGVASATNRLELCIKASGQIAATSVT